MNKALLNLRYQGFLKTSFLFKDSVFKHIQLFDDQEFNSTSFKALLYSKLRLGKLVERFVSYDLEQQPAIRLLAENIQIQRDKRTVGELDCLLLKDEIPIHLEIVYKFYLYDGLHGEDTLDRWIGPNRKDSLVQKLQKLKEKQFPLLYNPLTTALLRRLTLNSGEISQQLYFKAQLFVPLEAYKLHKAYEHINNECIQGFYISIHDLAQFKTSKFYIPEKLDWLIEPHTNVDWLSVEVVRNTLNQMLSEQRSPLCWIKQPNGVLVKIFIVWWT